MTVDDLEFLTKFVVNNPDLERLEARLAEFNIFEVLGAVRQELRHSDFLGYLLDPAGNHNLGDAFLKKLGFRRDHRCAALGIETVQGSVQLANICKIACTTTAYIKHSS